MLRRKWASTCIFACCLCAFAAGCCQKCGLVDKFVHCVFLWQLVDGLKWPFTFWMICLFLLFVADFNIEWINIVDDLDWKRWIQSIRSQKCVNKLMIMEHIRHSDLFIFNWPLKLLYILDKWRHLHKINKKKKKSSNRANRQHNYNF